MEKVIKIEFTENVKSVVANTKIEYTFRDGEGVLTNDTVLDEAKQLFNDASEYSKNMTNKKLL